jgi:signal transduction histidine kinase
MIHLLSRLLHSLTIHRIKLLVAVIILTCPTVSAFDRKAVTNNLLHQLALRPPYHEQVRLLYNIIDLTQSTIDSHSYYHMLFNLGKAHNDVALQLDAIRNMNNIFNDSMLFYINYVKTLPESNNRKETSTFLQYQYTKMVFLRMDNNKRSEYLLQLIKKYKTEKRNDIYVQTGKLMNLLLALSYTSTRDLFSNYLKELGTVIDRLPADGRNCLPNSYYAIAPDFYAALGMEKESAIADLKYQKFTDNLESRYRKQGRIYRNFDRFRYVSYRRMLWDTTYFSQRQIKEIFAKMVQLSKTNFELALDMNSPRSIARTRYYIATRQFMKAKPLIDSMLVGDKVENKVFVRNCLRIRIKIGLMTHDKNLLGYTLRYIDALESDIKNSINEKAEELQIIYDVNGLTQQVNNLELAKKQEEITASHNNTTISIIALIIVIILLVMTLRQLKRSKRLASNLKNSQAKLVDDKAKILDTMDKLEKARNDAVMADRQKTQFIQNMDHEIRTPLNAIVGFTQVITDPEIKLDDEEKDEYTDLIMRNNSLLQKLVNDVFDIAQIESGNIQMAIEPCSVNALCKEAVNAMSSQASEGVEMHFPQHASDITINTDRKLVLQLLGNYLSNACKFTAAGEIILDYSVDSSAENVTFSVTDTGIGIPAEKAEIIFNRFEKLNSFQQGTGLGLHVCKLIAATLHGKVRLDTSYSSGSRFLFIHPLK